MKNNKMYYILAIVVMTIWSTTFISTKVLLDFLTPVEIMFCRYIIGYITLFLLYPKVHKIENLKEELLFLGAGVFGGTLYFLSENYALKFSLTSNVSLLVAAAPLLTALVAHVLMKEEKANKRWYLGAAVAFFGVFLVVFNGSYLLKLNPLGDFLAILAALSWAFYSIIVKKLGSKYNGVYMTRKMFLYSIITMIPALLITDFNISSDVFCNVKVVLNLLFLGILASAICFVLWSKVVWNIGAVKANNFIYLVPMVTMIASALILNEEITFVAILGAIFIVLGVYISEKKIK